ncbi:MAG: class I SAM-dependent methyltransferase [Thermoplasmata archaeon]
MTSFDDNYQTGAPPWDIGHAQDEFVRLEDAHEIRGKVLDVGCGTGENALFLASHGHGVVGVDSAPTAIRMAQEKAADRKLSVDFRVGDARELDRLGLAFDTAIDSGLFHTFSDEDRVEFASSLHGALAPGGTYFVMCFNEREPSDWDGPRRVSQKDLRATFGLGWHINYIREAHFEAHRVGSTGHAWLASITRS